MADGETYQEALNNVEVIISEWLETAQVYAYDTYLIVCAMNYKAPLLTLDKFLIETAQEIRIKLLELNLSRS